MFGGFCVHRLNRGNPKIGLCLEKGHSVKKGEREREGTEFGESTGETRGRRQRDAQTVTPHLERAVEDPKAMKFVVEQRVVDSTDERALVLQAAG